LLLAYLLQRWLELHLPRVFFSSLPRRDSLSRDSAAAEKLRPGQCLCVRACLRGGGSIFRPTPGPIWGANLHQVHVKKNTGSIFRPASDLFEVPISITYTRTRTQGLSLDPPRVWGAYYFKYL
jgi:hypothetical protein